MARRKPGASPAKATDTGEPVGGRQRPAEPGPSTLAVHAGESTDPLSGAVNVPIQQSTTFRFPELEGGDGRRRAAPYIYSRYENPSLEAVERKVAALERARHSLLFSAGMAAVQAVCTS